MKRLIYIISMLFIAGGAFEASAVTDKEMEQARVIATQAYLRYANDGSGYLDQLHPKTMAELEKGLKAKEKENIKAFRQIPVPKDYASWDKQKLIEYWAVKAFSTSGLVEKGRIGKSRARKQISAMTVSAPASAQTASEAPAAQPAAPTETARPSGTQEAPQQPSSPQPAMDDSVKTALESAEALVQAAVDAGEEDVQIEKAQNHTWIYIVILCVLVAIVVALVVFASNVMKKNASAGNDDDDSRLSPQPASRDNGGELDAMREKFSATLAAKNNEIQVLAKKLEEVNRQNAALTENLNGLKNEVFALRGRLKELKMRDTASQAPAPQQMQSVPTQPASVQRPQAASQPAQPAAAPVRTIYLGRANAEGKFVRADRSLNISKSIYRLDTTDGYAGSFRVVNEPTVWEMALLTPRESLSNACVAVNIDDTSGMRRIVNDSAGTAIFEDGCWKVIRKAKIHFE